MKTKVLFSCILLSVLLVSCHSEPQPIKVTGITLNSSSLSLIEGETADLTATISPKDADNKAVIWSSSNGSVASVSNGRVSALSPGSTTITAKSDDGGFTATCAVSVAPRIIAVTSITLSKTELTLVEGESETIMATVQPDNATDKTVTWSSSDPTIATVDGGKITAIKDGTAKITAKAGNQSATCSVKVEKKPAPDAIDLGLSVKWASFNVGATKPEEYGDYFAWGETTTKDVYQNSTYKWFDSDGNLTKYNSDPLWGTVDNKTELELEDDAAHVYLGNNWRTPTWKEWRELYSNCDWAWVTINGVNGFRVTSKANENSIFLPAAGWKYVNMAYNDGYSGYYSSSTLVNSNPSMIVVLSFSQRSIDYNSHSPRRNGQSIRAVSD